MTNPLRTLACCLAAAAACACSAHIDTGAAPSTLAPMFTAPPSTEAEHAPTVEIVLDALKPAGATDPAVNTAEDDPNKDLGRPGQYTARATFALPGGKSGADRFATSRGGSIEIWPTAEAARKRVDYLIGVLAAGGPILGTEYDYLAGPVLVRVTGDVTPANAKKVEDTVKGLPQ